MVQLIKLYRKLKFTKGGILKLELVKDNLDQVNLNIESFSRMIGETWNVSPNIL